MLVFERGWGVGQRDGPERWSGVDFSLLKTTHLGINEGSRVEFHADVFNLFNRANFAPPVSTSAQVFNGTSGARIGTAGLLTKTVGQARQMQFGLKIVF